MKNIRTPRVVASCIAALFFLSASSAIADVNIGGNIIWHHDVDGTTIEVLGPSHDLDIQAIIDAIDDASETKRYIIKLGAGTYRIGANKWIPMKQYVSIQGSGVEATVILGAQGGAGDVSSAIVRSRGADDTSLTDLTISNIGGAGGDHSTGIYNDTTSLLIQRVAVDVSGGRINTGIFNDRQGSPTIKDVTIEAHGGSKATGVHNTEISEAVMTDVTVEAHGATDTNTGILTDTHFVIGTSLSLERVAVTARGGETARGVVNIGALDTQAIVMNDVSVSASEGTVNNVAVWIKSSNVTMTKGAAVANGKGYAVYIDSTFNEKSVTHIRGARLEGDSNGAKALWTNGHLTRIAHSLIQGDVDNLLPSPFRNYLCFDNYDAHLGELKGDCSPK